MQSQIPVTLEYAVTVNPDMKRFVRAAPRLQLALPLAVNVQDFFRDDCVISRFTVSTNDAYYIKIKQAGLSQVPGWRIEPCVRDRTEHVVSVRCARHIRDRLTALTVIVFEYTGGLHIPHHAGRDDVSLAFCRITR